MGSDPHFGAQLPNSSRPHPITAENVSFKVTLERLEAEEV